MENKKAHFYCQNLCGQVDFDIDEWNLALKYCDESGIKGIERDRILHPEKFPCSEQCFSCIAIVGERRLKTQEILSRISK